MPRSSEPPVLVLFEIGFVGDSIMTLPAMEALRRARPEARILRVVNSAMMQLWQGCPLCDELVAFDRRAPKLREAAALARRLRGRRPELFANLHVPDRDRPAAFYRRDAVFARATGARRRLAWSAGLDRLLLTDTVPRERFGDENMAVEVFRVIEPLGLALQPERVAFWHGEENRREAAEQLAEAGVDGGFLAVAPFGKDEAKELPEAELAELLARCAARAGLTPVLLGGPADAAKMERLRPVLRGRVVDLVGRNGLQTAAAILERARSVLAVDSGLMHLGALVGAPVTALFGPMPVHRWRPFRDERLEVFEGRTRGLAGSAEHEPFDLDAIAAAVAAAAR